MRPKLKVGDIIHVTFLDHSDGDSSKQAPLPFEVYGRLVKVTKEHYLIATWNTPGDSEEERYDANSEFFSIIRGAVVGVRRLK